MFNPFRDYLTKKKVIVNLKSNVSFRGIMWYTDKRYLVLRNAQILNQDLKKLDGEVVIERKEVEFIQVI